MAKGASKLLFLFLLSLHSVCSSGTLVGSSYHARGNTASLSATRTISFLKLNKISPTQIRVFDADLNVLITLTNSDVSVHLYLNQSLVEKFINSKSYTISWFKTHIMTFLPHVNIKSIIVRSSSNDLHGLQELLSTLKSIHSILKSSHFDNEVKVSVAFSFSFLNNLNGIAYEKDLRRILCFITKTRSFVIVEDSINGELTVRDRFVESVIETDNLAASMLPCDDVPMVLTIKIPTAASASEVAEFAYKASKSLENNTRVKGQIVELYVEVESMEDFVQKELEREEKQIFPSSGRELLSRIKTTLHDTVINPAIPTAPITIPSDNPTPTVVTVPSTNPVTITPTNPDSTPVPIPSTTPVTIPSTNPVNSPVPITNPVTTPAPITVPGAQPITNPVTTYPAPVGNVPVTTPVTNPVVPPVTTNAPAIPGQSWCVVKTGALENAIQAALDYACGIGGTDCSQIQQGASCYNPNSLPNHASYAFNSYYQKNPVTSSCDFGGTATIVSTNPSTGSCIYPSSAAASSTTTTPIATPAAPATTSSGSGTPPTVFNSSNPASGSTTDFGSDSPPSVNISTTSMSSGLQSAIGCVTLVTSLFTGIIILDI